MAARRFLLVALLAQAGCAGNMRARPSWPDAPVILRDDADRDQAIDALWVMPAGPERDRARSQIAAAIARRIEDAIDEERPFAAALLLDQLTWMWQADPAAIGDGLRPHAELLRRLRAMFAKSGALEPTVQTLVVLAEVDAGQRTTHLAEVDEILAFSDELAIADNGGNARRSQPIALLQPTALALPLPWLVDRYVTLLVERQRTVAVLLDTQGASMQLVRAHHDILSTGRRIANVLARAGRPQDIYARLQGLKGIGADRELSIRAEVLATNPTPDAYRALAARLREDDPNERKGDPAAALAVGMAGLAKFPGNEELLVAAAGDARALGRIDHAIQLYEAALRKTEEVDAAAALRLGTLYGERLERLATAGRPTAALEAWRGVLTFTDREAKAHPHIVWQQTQALAESGLGRGLASQGLVADARRSLQASLERAPSIDAYETLTTIDVQTDQFSSARQWAASGIGLLGAQTSGDRYRRAKLERLDGDALRRAGRTKEAAAVYLDTIRSWSSLGDAKGLPPAIAAERQLEVGRAMWWLGDPGHAVESALSAIELDADNAGVVAGATAFLLEVGRYTDALDAYHRGLTADIGDRAKIYMALWMACEAKHLGEPVDRLAAEYLANREGDTWYELLARAASGRISFDRLRALATTGPRKAELAYYGALLGLDPQAATPAGKRALLEQVLGAKLVLDAEYDLARRYLTSPTNVGRAAAP
jgi:tetratricopeptide (TPR) repeat protein